MNERSTDSHTVSSTSANRRESQPSGGVDTEARESGRWRALDRYRPALRQLSYHEGQALLSPDSQDAQSVARAGLSGPSSPVAASDAARVQQASGVDVSHARIHTGAAAHAATEQLGTRGFALGSDVALADSSPHVKFHELAHVAQQSGRAPLGAMGFRTPKISSRAGLEAEADAVADAAIAGHTLSAGVSSAAASVAMYDGPKKKRVHRHSPQESVDPNNAVPKESGRHKDGRTSVVVHDSPYIKKKNHYDTTNGPEVLPNDAPVGSQAHKEQLINLLGASIFERVLALGQAIGNKNVEKVLMLLGGRNSKLISEYEAVHGDNLYKALEDGFPGRPPWSFTSSYMLCVLEHGRPDLRHQFAAALGLADMAHGLQIDRSIALLEEANGAEALALLVDLDMVIAQRLRSDQAAIKRIRAYHAYLEHTQKTPTAGQEAAFATKAAMLRVEWVVAQLADAAGGDEAKKTSFELIQKFVESITPEEREIALATQGPLVKALSKINGGEVMLALLQTPAGLPDAMAGASYEPREGESQEEADARKAGDGMAVHSLNAAVSGGDLELLDAQISAMDQHQLRLFLCGYLNDWRAETLMDPSMENSKRMGMVELALQRLAEKLQVQVQDAPKLGQIKARIAFGPSVADGYVQLKALNEGNGLATAEQVLKYASTLKPSEIIQVRGDSTLMLGIRRSLFKDQAVRDKVEVLLGGLGKLSTYDTEESLTAQLQQKTQCDPKRFAVQLDLLVQANVKRSLPTQVHVLLMQAVAAAKASETKDEATVLSAIYRELDAKTRKALMTILPSVMSDLSAGKYTTTLDQLVDEALKGGPEQLAMVIKGSSGKEFVDTFTNVAEHKLSADKLLELTAELKSLAAKHKNAPKGPLEAILRTQVKACVVKLRLTRQQLQSLPLTVSDAFLAKIAKLTPEQRKDAVDAVHSKITQYAESEDAAFAEALTHGELKISYLQVLAGASVAVLMRAKLARSGFLPLKVAFNEQMEVDESTNMVLSTIWTDVLTDEDKAAQLAADNKAANTAIDGLVGKKGEIDAWVNKYADNIAKLVLVWLTGGAGIVAKVVTAGGLAAATHLRKKALFGEAHATPHLGKDILIDALWPLVEEATDLMFESLLGIQGEWQEHIKEVLGEGIASDGLIALLEGTREETKAATKDLVVARRNLQETVAARKASIKTGLKTHLAGIAPEKLKAYWESLTKKKAAAGIFDRAADELVKKTVVDPLKKRLKKTVDGVTKVLSEGLYGVDPGEIPKFAKKPGVVEFLKSASVAEIIEELELDKSYDNADALAQSIRRSSAIGFSMTLTTYITKQMTGLSGLPADKLMAKTLFGLNAKQFDEFRKAHRYASFSDVEEVKEAADTFTKLKIPDDQADMDTAKEVAKDKADPLKVLLDINGNEIDDRR